ncbi:MAG: phosphoadenosine phosphosulfate reductase family protein [Syntrophobacteraceae bacterium]|nr:phosphoadenosine phosphosulfate reductase family protein [Syntrophobacteraceae bacterium]
MSKPASARTYWCDSCQVPLLGELCGACGAKGRNIASATVVPVFKTEIRYLRQHVAQDLHPWLRELEMWVNPVNYTYYSQGKVLFKLTATPADVAPGRVGHQAIAKRTRKDALERLREANKNYIERLQFEAESFIREAVSQFRGRPILVSFSGGKDSTVASHLVMNALGRSDILHIFADTTIELPDTYKYLQRFQTEHPLTPFISSRSPLDFFKTAESIGPPSRILRWCCSTHKTNPLSKLIDSMSPFDGVLTFDGIRKAESSRRALYPRITTQHKIAREVLARPILEWSDLAVWIYLLYHDITFNTAYRKGFRRVGCLYCPFNSEWSGRMINYWLPSQDNRWAQFLVQHAMRINHQNPHDFVSKGWRTRAGGRGFDHYKATIESAPCLLSDTAVSYQLLGGEIKKVRHFLRPLGPQTHVKANGYFETFLIHDKDLGEVLASVEIGFEDSAIRINYLLKKNARLFQQRIEKQLRKLQSCIYCGSCEAVCSQHALCSSGNYSIINEKCVSCLHCVSHDCLAVKSLHFNGKK